MAVTDPSSYVLAFGALTAAGVGAFFRAEYLNRKQSRALLVAQKQETEMQTAQIVDELAKSWLQELRDEIDKNRQHITDLDKRLSDEIDAREIDRLTWAAARAGYVRHIQELEKHILDGNPPPPPPRPVGL